jgi:hypothetical protein
MNRIVWLLPFLLMSSGAFAQQGHPDPGCGRDASRFCRPVLDQGDMAILACLQQNRARLSRICAKALADAGR